MIWIITNYCSLITKSNESTSEVCMALPYLLFQLSHHTKSAWLYIQMPPIMVHCMEYAQKILDMGSSHYLNQWWSVYWRIYGSLGPNEWKLYRKQHFMYSSFWVVIVPTMNLNIMAWGWARNMLALSLEHSTFFHILYNYRSRSPHQYLNITIYFNSPRIIHYKTYIYIMHAMLNTIRLPSALCPLQFKALQFDINSQYPSIFVIVSFFCCPVALPIYIIFIGNTTLPQLPT